MSLYNPDYEIPAFSDFWVTIAAAPFFTLARWTTNKSVRPFYEKRIKAKYSGQAREDKKDKIVTNIVKCSYFFVWQMIGFYYILPQTSCRTARLGGEGTIEQMYRDFPFDNRSTSFKLYYAVSAAYHLESTVDHLISTPKNDFYEMIAHHFCTLLLIVFSYIL